MNISIIWKLSADENSNLITLQCLKEQIIAADLNVQVLIYQKEENLCPQPKTAYRPTICP